MPRGEESAKHLVSYFNLTGNYTALRKKCEAWAEALESNLTCHLFHVTKHYPDLMSDIFGNDAWSYLSDDQGTELILKLSAADEDVLQNYRTSCILGPMEQTVIYDAALLRVVKDQLDEYSDYQDMPPNLEVWKSPLWQAYAELHRLSSPTMRRTIYLICAADVLTKKGQGVAIMGPSTIPGAGAGAIAIGTAEPLHHEYLGPLISKMTALVRNKEHDVATGTDLVMDGSRVFTLASVMNSRPAKGGLRGVCRLEHDDGGNRVFAVMQTAITSAEIFCDYGMSFRTFVRK